MSIAPTFLSLTITIAFPLAIIALAFHIKKLKPPIPFLFFLNLIALGLSIGAFVNAIIGAALYSPAHSYYDSYSHRTIYYDGTNHECAWVALGLCLGAIALGLIVLITTFIYIRKRRNLLHRVKQKQQTIQQTNTQTIANNKIDYIDEIKRLKELLDCGAITEEEFTAKKKQLLGL